MNKIAMDLIEKLQPDNHWIDSKYFKLKMSNAKAQGSWGEQYVAETLRQEGHTAEIVTVPEYDLLVNDSIKVEVKFGMARIEKGETLLDLIMWQHLFFDKAPSLPNILGIKKSDNSKSGMFNPIISYKINWKTLKLKKES